MGANRRRTEREEQRVFGAKQLKAIRKAKRVVGIWNARKAGNRALWFIRQSVQRSPRAAPWVVFYCPACQQVGEIDLRKLDRHLDATIDSLIPALSCRRCSPNPPFARLLGLSDLPSY
jgi:hypothetical protein